MTPLQASVQITQDGSSLADAIRWRILLLLQNLDVPTLCAEAGIDYDRFKELLAEPQPGAELAAHVARFARVPIAEVIYGNSSQARADGDLTVLTVTSNGDLMQQLAGRLQSLEGRIERALLALMEVETRMSAAGLTPSDLVPPELISLYAPLTADYGQGGAGR